MSETQIPEIGKRETCSRCRRPIKACVCQYCLDIDNQTQVLILQHPSEQGRSKGTADLLRLSLENCTVLLGEDFSEDEALNTLLNDSTKKVQLLYPSDDAITLRAVGLESTESAPKGDYIEPDVLVLIDATWKKAFKMFTVSKNLHSLIKVTLPQGIEGRYRIRKTTKKSALSTLEACCYALDLLEPAQPLYKKLLESFDQFNDFQLSFRPAHHKINN